MSGDCACGHGRPAAPVTRHRRRARPPGDEPVPREEFVRTSERGLAYADEALPIAAGQTISQPYMVARMTELLAPRAGESHPRDRDRVRLPGGDPRDPRRGGRLDRTPAGAGCTARERLARLGLGGAVDIRVGDGSVGDPAGAPWDGIVVTAAAPSIPASLREQLSPDGGRLVIPVGDRSSAGADGGRSATATSGPRSNDGPCVFVPLVGEEGFPG